ncbi:hypothetical protein VPNG_01124 [Cytospora leucostoma]|uniref:t-SNARE coiled-coil homology domain-containing protein n=1 Tax=Cytospora leucostoma TaxID=1230097 RepID=A0A423XLB1_9PEZI|nr:hypothetical protein VPNG_01124 [Cytospora leucostoma]
MASRFNSTLHQRDSRSALFEGYTGSGADNRRGVTPSPSRLNPAGGGYGYGYPGAIPPNGSGNGNGSCNSSGDALGAGYRSATPNKRGQYSDAVLNELESQNDAHIEGIMGKVRVLKDVRCPHLTLTSPTFVFSFFFFSSSPKTPAPERRHREEGKGTGNTRPQGHGGYTTLTGHTQMTVAIGDEIRESSALAEKMNDQFDRARLRLRGTMNRMMLMAERTGVGWRVWLAFFAAVILLFTYVWLF